MRPRIRTLKPEIWADEKVGDLSHGARLLVVGLITMADDEGRLRELPAAILGHVFPYDNVSPAKLTRWLGEVERSGMVVRYAVAGKRYIAFPHWSDHQRVDKPNESDLPAPPFFDDPSPNGSGNGSGKDRGLISDQIVDRSRSLRAGADPIRSDPDPVVENVQGRSKVGSRRGRRVDQSKPPDGFPADKLPVLADCLSQLHAAWELRGGVEPQERGIGLAIQRNERADHAGVARKLVHWLTAGRGQRASCRDIAARFGDWVAEEPHAGMFAPTADGGQVVPLSRRERLVNDRNRFIDH